MFLSLLTWTRLSKGCSNDFEIYLLNTSSEKIVIPRNSTKISTLKKSKSFKEGSCGSTEASLSYSSNLITDSPGSIAGLRREQMALQHGQRKMKIAHYGRSKSAKFESVAVPLHLQPFLFQKQVKRRRKDADFLHLIQVIQRVIEIHTHPFHN